VHLVAYVYKVDKHLDDILRLQDQPYSQITPGSCDLFTSDRYLMHPGVGKDQGLEFIEV
jgi:hypothetical protein